MLHGFPFNGNTSYRKQYTPKDAKPMDPIKTSGNLKLGEPWIGSSTYRNNFMAPNKTYNTGWKSNLSNIPDPKYANQHGNFLIIQIQLIETILFQKDLQFVLLFKSSHQDPDSLVHLKILRYLKNQREPCL